MNPASLPELSALLQSVGLLKYEQRLREQDIGAEELLQLCEADFRELGLTMGAGIRIRKLQCRYRLPQLKGETTVEALRNEFCRMRPLILAHVNRRRVREEAEREAELEAGKTNKNRRAPPPVMVRLRVQTKEQQREEEEVQKKKKRRKKKKTAVDLAAMCPLMPMAPREGFRAHFSGGLIHKDIFRNGHYSKLWSVDSMGEYVGIGEYPDNKLAFPKSIAATFDAVAIDAGTRVVIYSSPNFQGDVVWEQSGPAMIWNTQWGNDPGFKDCAPDGWKVETSTSDMHHWASGSMRIWSGSVFTTKKERKRNAMGVYSSSDESSGSCLLYTSPSPRDRTRSRMPSSA
eukprot:TRINITY_DN22626_c0_g1_i1.p1 TRINITY_DN22626_c0_g1~~TRINITY_DN22626_c0_g1_i1.p1  ORF type:complete len:345 (-),score=76.32 TRINITY_DN22626_c0_g1_i1:23-1057(-)